MLFFLQQRMSTTETSFKKCACRNWEGFQPRSQMAHKEVSCSFPGPATGTRLHLTGKETGGAERWGGCRQQPQGGQGCEVTQRGPVLHRCPQPRRVLSTVPKPWDTAGRG